jgi:hypothetical protein
LAPNHITIYGAPYVSYVKKIILFPGKIIANISLFPETHSTLFCSGWVGILAEWARNSNLLISLPASKALSNLDQKYGKCTYAPGIYLVSPNDRVVQHQNELSNRGVDIVLLHGLLGGVFFTWRQHDKVKERSWTDPNLISSKDYTYCWPRDWLIEDGLDDGRVRIIGVDCKSIIDKNKIVGVQSRTECRPWNVRAQIWPKKCLLTHLRPVTETPCQKNKLKK